MQKALEEEAPLRVARLGGTMVTPGWSCHARHLGEDHVGTRERIFEWLVYVNHSKYAAGIMFFKTNSSEHIYTTSIE